MQLGFIGRNDLAGAEADAIFAAHHGFRGLEFNFWADFADVTEAHMRHIYRRFCSGTMLPVAPWGYGAGIISRLIPRSAPMLRKCSDEPWNSPACCKPLF